MTFSYSLSTQIGQVRLKIADTTSTDALFTDEELQIFLTDEGTVKGAAAAAAESLWMRYAQAVDFQTDDQRFDAGKRAERWQALAVKLRAQAGGISTVSMTKTDGYSDDIDASETNAPASRTGRNNYFTYNDRVY